MTPFFNESTYMCIFPIIICLIMQLVVPFPLQKIRKVSLSWRVISLFLSILYILMTSITEVIKDDFSLPAKCILLLVSLFSCFLLLIRAGSSEIRSFQHSFRKIGRTPIYTVMIPITLLTLFIISGCYPGVFSSDSASSWTDVAVNSFSDWHPVTYLYILKVIQRIFGNPFPLVLLQAFLWIAANYYALSLLEKYASFKYADILYTILSLIMIYSYRALGNIEKDTLWNISFFLFCLFIYDFVKTQKPLSWYKVFFFIISACMTATIRHMGNLIVLFSLLILFFWQWRKKPKENKRILRRLSLVLFSSIFIPIFLVNILGTHILHMVPNEDYVKYTIPVAMAGAVASKEDLPEKDIETLEQIIPIEKWREYYDKYYADSLSRTWGSIGEDALKLRDKDFQRKILFLNGKFLIKYPVTYLTAYFDMTSIIWEMGTPSDGYEFIPVTIYSSALDNYPGYSDLQIKPTISTDIQQKFFGVSDKIPIWSSICWRGGFSLFILLTCSCILIRKKRSREVLALLPALFLTAVLFLANPSQDPRYIDVYHMLMCFFLFPAASPSSRDIPEATEQQ